MLSNVAFVDVDNSSKMTFFMEFEKYLGTMVTKAFDVSQKVYQVLNAVNVVQCIHIDANLDLCCSTQFLCTMGNFKRHTSILQCGFELISSTCGAFYRRED